MLLGFFCNAFSLHCVLPNGCYMGVQFYFFLERAMPKIQFEAHIPLPQLLRAIEELSDSELEQLVLEVNAMVARRKARPSSAEAELLRKINQGVPREIKTRYDTLIAKWQAETLTEKEYAELLGLTQQVEKLEAERLANLSSLARLRGMSLPALMAMLGISDRVSG